MAANNLTVEQIYSLLNAIHNQATGESALAVVDDASFVSVGTSLLKSSYDTTLSAISQVLGRTIFSIRPYGRKFGGLEVDNYRFGNMTRKLSIADKAFESNPAFSLPSDGSSVDMFKLNRPDIFQENFYGSTTYQKSMTIFRNQLDQAFHNPQELGNFATMCMTNFNDMLEQAYENLARAMVANWIGGKITGDTGNVIHLLTEYNTLTGLTLDIEDIYQPSNFKPFMQFVYSRIADLCSKMTERSTAYHINVTGHEISRHTPYEDQRIYLYSPMRYQAEMMAIADVFHDNYLKLADVETVNFWQSIKTPDSINAKVSYLKAADGSIVTTTTAVEQDAIFGVIMDKEAMGYTIKDTYMSTTPYNSAGGYWNVFAESTVQWLTSYTENGVVLLLD